MKDDLLRVWGKKSGHGIRTAELFQNFPTGTEEYHEEYIVMASISAEN